MNLLEKNLSLFNPINLEQLNSVALMQRHDTKFLLHAELLWEVLQFIQPHYDILEISGKRNFKYETMYYDTDDYYFYHQHHNQRLNRYKIRCRKYTDSEKCFFEIKFKNNKNKTIKTRCAIHHNETFQELSSESKRFAEKNFIEQERFVINDIRPQIKVDYNRVTFASRELKERVTFDTSLCYSDNDSKTCTLNNLVIAELKQERVSKNSPIAQCLRELRISPANFSKYCIGVILSDKKVKANRFKKKIIDLQKFM